MAVTSQNPPPKNSSPRKIDQPIKILLPQRVFSAHYRLMLKNPDVRWRQRFQSFCKAFSQLAAAGELAKQRKLSELEQQGLIQAFEFTHELAWNTLKDFLESRGAADIYGSKDATRAAFEKGLLANGDEWMAMIQARNHSSHTYNEKTAHQIVAAILPGFIHEFAVFRATFSELEERES